MITKLLLVGSLFFSVLVSAQDTKDLYKVKNDTDISKTLPPNERYQFREFRDGKVYFRNGRISVAKLNYSIVHSEVQFIDPLRDTMLLADNNFVDKVTIADDIFYYFEGYGHIQQIDDSGKTKLGKKTFLEIAGDEKYSAYEQYSSTSAITAISSYMSADGKMQPLSGNTQVLLRKRVFYFWIDQNRRLYTANRSNLLKIYRSDKKGLNRFIDENNIDFEKEESLLAVLKFTGTL